VTAAWDVELYPTSFLVDGSGHIRYRVTGALEWDSENAIQTIEALMAEQTTAVQAGNASDLRYPSSKSKPTE
jgi:hypothetical protein